MNIQSASFLVRSKAKRKEHWMAGARSDAALASLENEGFEIGAAVIQRDGRVQITVSSKNDSAMVEVGQELWAFAAGLVTLREINARRKAGQ